MEGWIKLHRCLLDSYVFSNPTTLKIWIWILCKAANKKRVVSLKVGIGFQDIELNPGELIFGRFKAEEQLNIDGSTIYKHIQKLVQSNNITLDSNNHYTIITVCNWAEYQESENKKEQPNDSQMTAKEQQSNNRRTTEEHKQESKESKEIKKEYPQEIIELNLACKKYFEEKYINDKSLECFEKLIRIDKYTIVQIKKAILNARSDSFWDENFLSPLKLRDKDKNGVKFIDRFLKIKTNGNNKTTAGIDFEGNKSGTFL